MQSFSTLKRRVKLITKITFSQTPTVRQALHRGFWIDELLYFSFSAKATWVSSAGKRIEWDRAERQHSTRHLCKGCQQKKGHSLGGQRHRCMGRTGKGAAETGAEGYWERHVSRECFWRAWGEKGLARTEQKWWDYRAHTEAAEPAARIFRWVTRGTGRVGVAHAWIGQERELEGETFMWLLPHPWIFLIFDKILHFWVMTFMMMTSWESSLHPGGSLTLPGFLSILLEQGKFSTFGNAFPMPWALPSPASATAPTS